MQQRRRSDNGRQCQSQEFGSERKGEEEEVQSENLD